MIEASHELEARILEGARRDLVASQGHALGAMEKFASGTGSKAGRERMEAWIAGDDPLRRPVEDAMRLAGVPANENPDLAVKVAASLKHRLLTGAVTTPVYFGPQSEHRGICAHMTYDEDSGFWGCKLAGSESGSQAKADDWHARYGNSPACPYWKNPARQFTDEETYTDGRLGIEELFGKALPPGSHKSRGKDDTIAGGL